VRNELDSIKCLKNPVLMETKRSQCEIRRFDVQKHTASLPVSILHFGGGC